MTEKKKAMSKTEYKQGPVKATPMPVDPTRIEFEVVEDRMAALRERITILEGMVHAVIPSLSEADRRHMNTRFITGPVISGPDSQSIKACSWDSVLVIVSRPNWFGGGATPVNGATVRFSITQTFGTTGPQISSGPKGAGTVVAPGGTIRVPTNANGEALIYVHDTPPGGGKLTLNADTSGAWSKDIMINFM